MPILQIVVDGNEHEPTDRDGDDRADTPVDGRTDKAAEKPISFDFKLRLGSRESTAALTGRATGELVQLQPIDWDSFTGLRDDDAPREYKTDGDLPSIIVELANQIAGPDTLAQAAVRMRAMANGGFDDDSVEMYGEVGASDHLNGFDQVTGYEPAPVPDIPVVTVDDDPLLSAVVDKILDEPDEIEIAPAPVVPVAASIPKPAAIPEPAPTVEPMPVAAAPEAARPVSAVAPAVRAPAQPVEEGPIELPRIVALTPDLPSGEIAQSSLTPPSVPQVAAPVSAQVSAQVPVAPQMLSGAEALAMAAAPAPALAAAPVMAPAAVTAPAPAPMAPLQLAKIERKPGAARPTKPVDFHALLGEAGMQPMAAKRRKKRHPIRALFKLVVVLAIIGGGLFFGKKLVLDMRWDRELKPFADAVSEARELKWDKPVEVTSLSLSAYSDQLVNSEFGIDANQRDLAAEWRAMGLLEGDLDLDNVGRYASGFRPVMYDPTDQTIYELEGLRDDLREFYLYEAMGQALLDQQYHWSEGLATLGRAERTGRLALVEADASATTWTILEPSDIALERIAGDSQDLVDESGVVIGGAADYPAALLIGPAGEAKDLFGDDVLESIEQRNALIENSVANDAAVLDGLHGLTATSDEIGDPTETAGMAYWYYVLAGRIPAAGAWNAAVAWDGDQTVFDSTADGDCVSATIAAVDEPGRLLLLGALQRWAAAAPAEAATTVAEQGSERIQVHSCDPGTAADTKGDVPVPAWGLGDMEYSVLDDQSLVQDVDDRKCTINALRNFGVLGQELAGDVEGAKAVTDQILASCSGA